MVMGAPAKRIMRELTRQGNQLEELRHRSQYHDLALRSMETMREVEAL